MTAPAPVQQPALTPEEQQVIAILAGLLLAGAATGALLAVVKTLPGLPVASIELAWKGKPGLSALANKVVPSSMGDSSTPTAIVRRRIAATVAGARAAYLVRATERLATAYATGDPVAIAKARAVEVRYRAHHEAMTQKRVAAGRRTVAAIGRRKPDAAGRLLLGWYHPSARGLQTEKPCPLCAPYVGRNFDALNPPAVGYPGMVHPHDYCTPGLPFTESE